MTKPEPPSFIVEKANLLLEKWKQLSESVEKKKDKLLTEYSVSILDQDEDKFTVEVDEGIFQFSWSGEADDADTPKNAEEFAFAYSDLIQNAHSYFRGYAVSDLKLEEYDDDMYFTLWLKDGWFISINNWASDVDEVEVFENEERRKVWKLKIVRMTKGRKLNSVL